MLTADQAQAFGHACMKRSLLIKMFYNTKEEWQVQGCKILRRLIGTLYSTRRVYPPSATACDIGLLMMSGSATAAVLLLLLLLLLRAERRTR